MHTGLLLPHFGEHADPTKIIEGARAAERLGFDSVWARDHLLFEPHGEFEQPNPMFYEALTVLTAVGAVTDRLVVGTGALIPFRHPLVLAQTLATMVELFGPRVIVGMGSGNFDHEFEAVGLGGLPRPELVVDNFEIMRRLWSEDGVDWDKPPFSFTGAAQSPKPGAGAVPLWYCGTTPKSARLAAQFGDGFLPGRIGIATLRKRVALLGEQALLHNRPMSKVGIIPTASIADTREKALSRVNVPGLLEWANKAPLWVKPASGRFETVDDLEGILIHGTVDDVLEQCSLLSQVGVDHLVFDFRLSFPEWEEQMGLLGEEVLPRLKTS
jgi:alkanesulfonate monooxygenase SsuD/methylene tetrahydromethanopterin reductase-like flavin-dependent oxidoreductase (luciferase family)